MNLWCLHRRHFTGTSYSALVNRPTQSDRALSCRPVLKFDSTWMNWHKLDNNCSSVLLGLQCYEHCCAGCNQSLTSLLDWYSSLIRTLFLRELNCRAAKVFWTILVLLCFCLSLYYGSALPICIRRGATFDNDNWCWMTSSSTIRIDVDTSLAVNYTKNYTGWRFCAAPTSVYLILGGPSRQSQGIHWEFSCVCIMQITRSKLSSRRHNGCCPTTWAPRQGSRSLYIC